MEVSLNYNAQLKWRWKKHVWVVLLHFSTIRKATVPLGFPSLAVKENGWLVFPKHFCAIPRHQLAQQKEVPSPILSIPTPTEKHIIRKHSFRGSSILLFSFEVFHIERIHRWSLLSVWTLLMRRSSDFFSSLWMGREKTVLFLLAEKQGRWTGYQNLRSGQIGQRSNNFFLENI